jgi:hypothetical protein
MGARTHSGVLVLAVVAAGCNPLGPWGPQSGNQNVENNYGTHKADDMSIGLPGSMLKAAASFRDAAERVVWCFEQRGDRMVPDVFDEEGDCFDDTESIWNTLPTNPTVRAEMTHMRLEKTSVEETRGRVTFSTAGLDCAFVMTSLQTDEDVTVTVDDYFSCSGASHAQPMNRAATLFHKAAAGLVWCYQEMGERMPTGFDESGTCGPDSIWLKTSETPVSTDVDFFSYEGGGSASFYLEIRGGISFDDAQSSCRMDAFMTFTAEDAQVEVSSLPVCE